MGAAARIQSSDPSNQLTLNYNESEPSMAPLVSIKPAPEQAGLFDEPEVPFTRTVALTPEVEDMLRANCVVAVGVSGGKDSQACALAVARHLDQIGHTGPRLLIHAHLGMVEWEDSLPSCRRLAAHLGWELVVTERQAGGLMERWEKRWQNNVARYVNLACVKLILPWSTASMRFCTSEAKAAPIASALRKRFPDMPILNVTGIRHQESPGRSKMPVSGCDARLARIKKDGVDRRGIVWNAIIEWPIDEVFAYIAESGLGLHEAYTRYGSSRVSCTYCILASKPDLVAATTCAANRDVYVRMVELEAASTFSFRSGGWLADVAPALLPEHLRERIVLAKMAAQKREEAEAMLPAHLLFTKGWPTRIPTEAEAELIASVRRQVAAAVGIEAQFLDARSVRQRYTELFRAMKNKANKEAEEEEAA